MSARLAVVTETPKAPAARWAAIRALISEGRAFEARALEAKSEEGELLMLDEAHARYDQVIDLLVDDDAEPMLVVLSAAACGLEHGV